MVLVKKIVKHTYNRINVLYLIYIFNNKFKMANKFLFYFYNIA